VKDQEGSRQFWNILLSGTNVDRDLAKKVEKPKLAPQKRRYAPFLTFCKVKRKVKFTCTHIETEGR